MEQINLRDCFPIMNGGDGIILSKRGDVTFGWELELPPSFTCNEDKYDSLVATLHSAIQLLPDWTIVHKQDLFMEKTYHGDALNEDFLSQSYARHFDGRKYLDHCCRIYVTFSTKNNIHNATSGLMGISDGEMSKSINRFTSAADQFETIVTSNELFKMHRLTEDNIFGTEVMPGMIQDYLNFTDAGKDIISDLQMEYSCVRTGDKFISCHLISDLIQLPGEVSPYRRVSALSTENSNVNLSFLCELGQNLACEHIVNQFIIKEPSADIHADLNMKRRRMGNMSLKSTDNRIYAEEIQEYLDEATLSQVDTIHAHINILAAGSEGDYDDVKDKVTAAISKIGLTPVYDIHDTPLQFWASMPGNESGIGFHEYMTMKMDAALCLWLYDGQDRGFKKGVMRMCDRQRLIPVIFDIQEEAMNMELVDNFNVFLLGPSGSGKSFFMNSYLHSCYAAGEQCFLIDVGDSYRALCNLIREESNGRDGAYYSFEAGKPISFNPFRQVKRFCSGDDQALDFLYTLMCLLWKNGQGTITNTDLKYIKDSVNKFVKKWKAKRDPIFNDYFDFMKKDYLDTLGKELKKESFDLENYLETLEQFYGDGPYGYLLNSNQNIDILNDRFVVFEIDNIKDNKVIYPITTLVIMDAFMEKMRSSADMKVMVIEEAWKAIMGTQMASYMLELWKTARKHRTSAVVVTQELKDILSSEIIKDSIVENSAVKILLDQRKYLNKFEVLSEQLAMTEDDKALVLSMNRHYVEGAKGREVFFNLGNKRSFVMRLEACPEEIIAYSSKKEDKQRLAEEVRKTGSYKQAIINLAKAMKS